MTEAIDAVEVPADLVAVYRDTQTEIKRLTELAETVKDALTTRLGEHEYATVDGDPVIRWARVTSRRLDMQALREAVDPAVLSTCYATSEQRRFLVLTTKLERA